MSETTLRKDSEWSIIDGEACRVTSFIPSASVENGKVVVTNQTEPYAMVIFECKKASPETRGYITHKIDFAHLWAAFKERGLSENEEVIIFWSTRHLKAPAKLFSAVMPKLTVMICPKGAYEIMTDSNYKPELTGEARFNAERPIVEWKPET